MSTVTRRTLHYVFNRCPYMLKATYCLMISCKVAIVVADLQANHGLILLWLEHDYYYFFMA